jgi:hypothetical protein
MTRLTARMHRGTVDAGQLLSAAHTLVASSSYHASSPLLSSQAPKIDITGVKPAVLLNVGLLTCTLHNGSTQIVEIKIMTQVTKRKDGVLMRVMFDPLA